MQNELENDDPLGPLAEAFVQSYRRGEAPSIQQWANAHPALAARIGKVFPTLVVMEELSSKENTASAPLDRAFPKLIGDYRIEQEIGRGGMGVVYRARQVSLGREVALKVLSGSLSGNGRALERFRFEARTAGQLHHPNIVSVFEVGQEGSTHFYAMQLIDGQSLDKIIGTLRNGKTDSKTETIRAADENNTLPIRLGEFDSGNRQAESIDPACDSPSTRFSEWKGGPEVPGAIAEKGHDDRRFRHIARIGHDLAVAISFAHDAGILHRDVKPSNVILDKRDHLWITDFGLAKARDFANEGESGFTGTGDVVGTIRYMPPERFRGWSDTRSDVYGIGITLYELLTLQPAFDSPDQLELIEKIRTSKPLRPRLLDRRIPRDLETIVLKAMENEPGARYATASALAEDLRRFSESRPILARRASTFERIRQWARRNPAAASLSTAFVVFLVGALVVTFTLWKRADTSAKEATRNLDLAISAIDQYCTRVSEDLRLKEQDLRPLRKELLSTAVDFHQQLVSLRNLPVKARIDLARAHARLGRLSLEIDAPERALSSFRLAIDEYRTFAKDPNEQPSNDLELANCFRDFAKALYLTGEPDDAKLAIAAAVAILDNLLLAEPRSVPARSALADIRSLQSYWARGFGMFDDSEAYSRLAIEDWGILAKEQPDDPESLSNWAYAQSQLGKAIFDRDNTRWREAEMLLLESLANARQATILENATTLCAIRLGDTLRGLGRISSTVGKPDEAIGFQSEAAEIFETTRLKEPSVRLHTIMLSGIYTEMARAYRRKDDQGSERLNLERAIELLEPMSVAFPGDRSIEVQLVETASQLGLFRLNEGDLEGAGILLDQAVELAGKNLQRSSEDRHLANSFPVILQNRATLRLRQGRMDDALRDHNRSVEVAKPSERGPRRIARGEFHLQLGDYRQAMMELNEARTELSSETSPRIWAMVLMNGAKLSARCSAAADSDKELDAEEQTSLAQEYAAIAVGLLDQAIQRGFPDTDSLWTMPEFESLRAREDFKSLRK